MPPRLQAAARDDGRTLEERRRRRLLRELLDEWEKDYGPPDEDLVQHFMDLMR